MSDFLERVIAQERRYWAALVQHDDGLPDLFDDLCRRTGQHVRPNRVFQPRYAADSAFNPSGQRDYYRLPSDLSDEWDAYAGHWRAFLAVNPRCRLASTMSWISETHDFSSWPYGWEDPIRDWVTCGLPGDPPFEDRMRIVTGDWRRELASTAEACGEGWIYYSDDGTLVWR